MQGLLPESSTKTERFLQEVTKQILLTGTSAPYAGKIKLRTFIAIENESIKEQLYGLCENQGFL